VSDACLAAVVSPVPSSLIYAHPAQSICIPRRHRRRRCLRVCLPGRLDILASSLRLPGLCDRSVTSAVVYSLRCMPEPRCYVRQRAAWQTSAAEASTSGERHRRVQRAPSALLSPARGARSRTAGRRSACPEHKRGRPCEASTSTSVSPVRSVFQQLLHMSGPADAAHAKAQSWLCGSAARTSDAHSSRALCCCHPPREHARIRRFGLRRD
jgi:hypothetical protein